MKGYEPDRDRLSSEKIFQRLKINKSFKNVFTRDITDYFYEHIYNTVNSPTHTKNTIISIYGLTGTGKSGTAFTIGLKFFKNFDNENVYFFDQQILKNAHKFEMNSLIIRDENPQDAVYGVGSTRISRQFSLLGDVCRKYGLNLILIEPDISTNSISKYYLETIDMDTKKRITRLALIDPITKMFLGSVYVKIVSESNNEWIKYNKRKDEFIENIRFGDFSDSKIDHDDIIKEIVESDQFEFCNTKSEKISLVSKLNPNLTTGEIKQIVDLIIIKMRQRNG